MKFINFLVFSIKINCRNLFLENITPIFLGFSIFLIFLGTPILHPSHFDWMVNGDSSQHLLGWEFFRNTPFSQFPVGLNLKLGELLGSSIVYSDSIPLFAIPAKFLRNILPENFQYFGYWILFCFVMQGIFSWKILSRFIDDYFIKTLGVCFFILAPTMLWRLAGHEALLAHWVILAAINFYLDNKYSYTKWIFLLVLTTLIHAYLLAMVLILYLAAWKKSFVISIDLKYTCHRIGELIISAALLFITMYIVGYFVTLGSTNIKDFGGFKMNVLSLIDSDVLWSRIVPGRRGGGGEYEGFNYLGLGLIFLSLITLIKVFTARYKFHINLRLTIPLIVVSTILTIYALTNHISIGSHEIFSYSLPHIFDKFYSTFRTPGRFFWPVTYLIYITIFYCFVNVFNLNTQKFILFILLGVQIIDISGGLYFYKNRYSQKWNQPLNSAFWENVPNNYFRFAYDVPSGHPPMFFPLAFFAARNGISINDAYLARFDSAKLESSKMSEKRIIEEGIYDKKTVYFFTDDSLWKVALNNARKEDFIGVVDGYRLLAPGWSACVLSCGLKNLGGE